MRVTKSDYYHAGRANSAYHTVLCSGTCNKKNYAGAHCFKAGYSDLKIVGDFDWTIGKVVKGIPMIKYNNQWGTVCGNIKYTRY